jgi:hypothetical protein
MRAPGRIRRGRYWLDTPASSRFFLHCATVVKLGLLGVGTSADAARKSACATMISSPQPDPRLLKLLSIWGSRVDGPLRRTYW